MGKELIVPDYNSTRSAISFIDKQDPVLVIDKARLYRLFDNGPTDVKLQIFLWSVHPFWTSYYLFHSRSIGPGVWNHFSWSDGGLWKASIASQTRLSQISRTVAMASFCIFSKSMAAWFHLCHDSLAPIKMSSIFETWGKTEVFIILLIHEYLKAKWTRKLGY